MCTEMGLWEALTSLGWTGAKYIFTILKGKGGFFHFNPIGQALSTIPPRDEKRYILEKSSVIMGFLNSVGFLKKWDSVDLYELSP